MYLFGGIKHFPGITAIYKLTLSLAISHLQKLVLVLLVSYSTPTLLSPTTPYHLKLKFNQLVLLVLM